MSRLADKICVITGGGSGIGQATALCFAAEGAKVVVADINPNAASETSRLIEKNGAAALAVTVDVTQAASVQKMLHKAVEVFGRIDVLVNNAGLGFAATVEETDEADWDRLMAVNLKGVFLGCKYVVPIMRRQGGGVIVNTASVLALVGVQDRAAYCASKGGVAALTRAVALDHVRDGIRVNCVAPGSVETPYWTDIFAKSNDVAALRKNLEQRHPMERLARPEEIAKAILFLASDESSFCTGSTLVVDGGWAAR